ncbi:MAG: hypothetical protein U5N86_07955 [Planctomycetota bacterium]|nr:hypothetical protein [Planctomycetota bacterium]
MIVNEAVGLVARLEKQLVVSTDSKDSLRPTEQQLYLKVRDMKLREVCSVPVDLERYSELLSDSEWQVSTRLLSDFGAVLPDIVSVGSESVLLSISGRTCTVLIREDYTHGASVEWASTYPCFVYSCENSVELLVVGRISDEYIQDSMHMPTLSSVESVFFLDVTTPMPVVYEPVNVDALEYAVFANCVWLTGTEVLVASSNPSEIAVFDFGKDKITARWPLADYKKVSCHLVQQQSSSLILLGRA